jgi:hypothetical protein
LKRQFKETQIEVTPFLLPNISSRLHAVDQLPSCLGGSSECKLKLQLLSLFENIRTSSLHFDTNFPRFGEMSAICGTMSAALAKQYVVFDSYPNLAIKFLVVFGSKLPEQLLRKFGEPPTQPLLNQLHSPRASAHHRHREPRLSNYF